MTVFTAHDPLQHACAREGWRKLALRRAQGCFHLVDASLLIECCRILQLTPADFEADVEMIRTGRTPSRVAGQWPDEPDVDATEVADAELVPVNAG